MRILIPRRSPSGPAAPWLATVLLCFAGLAGVAGLAGPAAAQPGPAQRRGESLAIARLPFQGVTREIEATLRQALREGLAQGGFEVLPDAEVEGKLQRDPQLAACSSRSCFAREALTLGVLRIVEGEVQRPQRSTYRVRLQLRDLRTGQLASAPEEERCDICGTEEARQMIARVATRLCRAAPALGGPAAPDTGTLQVDSQPLGAEVIIDGLQQEDRTPAMFILPVGVHSLELRAAGHKPLRRPVEIGPGRHVALNLELIGIPPRRPWLTALSAVLLTGAVGMAVTGGVLWHYDGKPVPGEHPSGGGPCLALVPGGHCPEKYQSLPGAIASVGIAGALLVGGVVSIYYDYAPPRRRLIIGPATPTLLRAP